MKLNAVGRALSATVSVSVIVGLVVTACGSDDNIGPRAGIGASRATAGAVSCAGKNAVTGEGSTAQQNAIALFNQAWGQLCPGKNVSYNPTGSAAGFDQFMAGEVDFAGMDSPLTTEQSVTATRRCGGHSAWNLPMVFGPIALTYNLDGVGRLVVNADVLAKIFGGGVTSWNDPAIAALNSGIALPATEITPIYRSDSSGTTENFQKYLSIAAPQSWTRGGGGEFRGGAGEGAEKSAGVVQAVEATPGAIGYVEKGFADQGDLPFAQIDSGSGAVPLTEDAASKAIESAEFAGTGNDLTLELNSLYGSKEPGTYPLMLAVYEIVCSKGYDSQTSAAVKSFLTAAANDGQSGLASAGYIPLPGKSKARLVASIDAIK